MKTLDLNTNPSVELVFANYPETVRAKMQALRTLVLDTAKEHEEISSLEETLKWGEPSYLSKIGSTVRIDWKAKTPEQYAMYFKCTSRLVETFRTQFPNSFNFEGNRAIVFQLNEQIPEAELKRCIKAALTYHRVKKLPTLGI